MNQMTESKSDTITYVITYKSVESLSVTMPKKFGPYDVIDAFAKAYVEQVCKRSVVSDSVLFDSIGASVVREVMLLGIQHQLEGSDALFVFEEVLKSDNHWKLSALNARYGEFDGTIKFLKLNGLSQSDATSMVTDSLIRSPHNPHFFAEWISTSNAMGLS